MKKFAMLRWAIRIGLAKIGLGVVVLIGLPLFLLGGFSGSSSLACSGEPASVGGETFNANQVAIAHTIVQVGQTQKLPDKAIIAALMAGLGESDLVNLDHGDAVRNDTIGVFQIGPEHGTREQRMDPAWSAGNFYQRLLKVPHWETLTETHAIHRAQINADPEHYQKYLPTATALYTAVVGGGGCGGADNGSTGASGVKGWGGYTNGLIPTSVLCPVPWLAGRSMGDGTEFYARCDYIKALTALNNEFKTVFGRNLELFSAYRSQAYQASLCVNAQHACAAPGTSVHGLGLAIDFASGINLADTPQHKWMVANAGRYGIVHPAWAQKPGKGFEPWHWEFNPDLGIRTGVVTASDVAAASDANPATKPT